MPQPNTSPASPLSDLTIGQILLTVQIILTKVPALANHQIMSNIIPFPSSSKPEVLFNFEFIYDGAVSTHSFKGENRWFAAVRANTFASLMAQRLHTAVFILHSN